MQRHRFRRLGFDWVHTCSPASFSTLMAVTAATMTARLGAQSPEVECLSSEMFVLIGNGTRPGGDPLTGIHC